MDNGEPASKGETVPLEVGGDLSAQLLYPFKRLRSRDEENDDDDLFVKHLRTIEERIQNLSKVVVRLGPKAEKYELHLPIVRLITQSVKLMGIIEANFEKDGKGSVEEDEIQGSVEEDGGQGSVEEDGIQCSIEEHGILERSVVYDENGRCSAVVIDLPDLHCDVEIFRMVDEFCFCNGLTEKNIISTSNVVRLFNAAKFLQIEPLVCAVQKFLEKNVFDSWENCLAVLSTFDCNDVPSADADVANTKYCVQGDTSRENILFNVCLKNFMTKIGVRQRVHDIHINEIPMGCSAECLIQVAKHLQPNIAKHIYQACRVARFGLFLNQERSWIINHQQEEARHATLFCFDIENGDDVVRWVQDLSYLLRDSSKRLLLVFHLSQMMGRTNSTGRFVLNIELSFLCALLVQATQLNKFKVTPGREIPLLTKLVAEGLSDVLSFKNLFAEGRGDVRGEYAKRKEEDQILKLVMKFSFGTLLSIVEKFRWSAVLCGSIVNIGNLVDGCILDHIKAKSFSTQQALIIYQGFPNHLRPSHLNFYQTLRTVTSEKKLVELTKLLDYDKLPDDVVENLFTDVQLVRDADLVERFRKIQRMKQREKSHADEQVIKLRSELSLQTIVVADLEKVRSKLRAELSLRTADLIQVRMDKELEERKRKDELERTSEVHKANSEEVVHLRNELDAMREAKKLLEDEKIRLISDLLTLSEMQHEGNKSC